MKKNNNIFTISATLNLLHLFVCLATVSVKGIDILDNFYVRIALLVLEISVWMLAGMYLFIKYDVKKSGKALKTAALSVLPVIILTGIAAAVGYFGDSGKSSWLLFAFLGTALTFYNKPAVLLTGLIPIADAYILFAVNYVIIFIATLVGTLIASKINRSLAEKLKEEVIQPKDEMSVTQLIDKIEEDAEESENEEEKDEELSDIVLEETFDETKEDSTLALVSIDDDDDDSEIISQEAVEIISLDVVELEEAAEEELRKRYDDIPVDEDPEEAVVIAEEVTETIQEEIIVGTTGEQVEEAIEEALAEEISSDEEFIPVEELIEEATPIEEIFNDEENEDANDVFAQLFDEEITEDDSTSFEEVMEMVEEIIEEDSGWTFLTEEESDRLISLALASTAETTEEEESEFENEEGEEVKEEISFEEIIDMLSPSDEAEEVMTEEIVEEVHTKEITTTPEETSDELSTENPQNEDNFKTEEEMTEKIIEEPADEITGEPELNFAALEGIFEDFSDISIEDIMEADNIGDEIYEDLPVIDTPHLEDPEDDIITEDNSDEEIIFDDEDDDISEDEIKNLIRGEKTSEDAGFTESEDITTAAKEIIEEDEISIIADYVEAVSSKEIDNIISSDFEGLPTEVKKTGKKDKELEKKKAKDKEFDNWLNRKTARLDVKAIKKALEEKEE